VTPDDLSRLDILLVSTADWDNPYWTNKQHVATELARRGHRILYIESQGLRRPSASARDLSRIWRRLKRGLRPPRRVSETLWVLSPLVIPFQSSPAIRKLNRQILAASIRFWCLMLRIKPSILWTYSPMTPEFYDLDRYRLLVYHAVDDITAQPGMPKEAIAQAEEVLSRRADLIFTTAPHLQAVHSRLNPNTHFFPNVADFHHFNQAMDADLAIPAELAALPSPRIGFIGAISGYKQDFELLRAVCLARPDWSVILIGEIGEGDPWTDSASLKDLPNLHLLGGRPYAQLPAYLKGFDVAMLPSKLNDYTRSMFPMKFFEYLAAGRQVVGTQLPALQEYKHVAMLVDGTDSFIAAIETLLSGQGPSLEERLEAARSQTYETRTGKMMDIATKILARR
jgi:glycosyltransferase involved in cell wall biosynthesis